MDSYQIIDYIANSVKKTPAKIYLKGELSGVEWGNLDYYGDDKAGVIFCELNQWKEWLSIYSEKVKNYRIELDRINSAIPLADLTRYNARIEPGAHIREMVEIENGAVIMMGAVLNIGCFIGEKTMVDMNVVVGGRAIVGKYCHLGAGCVIAGVIEPPSADPVVIEDRVLVGANAVITEGVRIGHDSVVAAGAVVISDVPPYTVVAGIPARKIKDVDMKTKNKTLIIDALRRL
jgi:2,3,4,5-tetrahydropyridine-2,6-dicarboxylate N-acetyltransferase